MSRRLIGSVVGALAVAGLAAPVAHAGTPAKVSVRAEAPGRTIVSTTLTTTRTKVRKDDDASHTCSGTSAAGALEQATGGKWTASWFDGLGYAVDSIGGVKAPADFSAYWTLWINGKPSTTGVCDSELQAGDEVLEFLCTSTPDFSSCTNLPLELRAGRVSKGHVTVTVVRLKGDGTSTKVMGATVRGGVKTVTTGTDGHATVELREGQTALRGTHTGDVASAPLNCALNEEDGRCGSDDRTPPVLTLLDIEPRETFAAEEAPRVLRGIARDPGGVRVALKLTRFNENRCSFFIARLGAFRRCGATRPVPFEAGDRARWSYLLPSRLGPGSYKLLVHASDSAGNVSSLKTRFTVEAAG